MHDGVATTSLPLMEAGISPAELPLMSTSEFLGVHCFVAIIVLAEEYFSVGAPPQALGFDCNQGIADTVAVEHFDCLTQIQAGGQE